MRRLGLGLVPLVPFGIAIASCQRSEVAIALTMRAPEALLDQATAVRLTVADATAVRCNAKTGHIGAVPQGTTAQTFDLHKGGCSAGAAWCTDIELDRDGSERTFGVVVRKGTATTAEGCTTRAIDQDPLEVDVKVHRVVPPACCNDGQLQPGEQCDSGVVAPLDCSGNAAGKCAAIVADEVCACDCKAQEIPVDRAASDPLPAVGAKSELALAFTSGAVSLDNEPLRAAFTDRSSLANGGADVDVRYFNQDVYSFSQPPMLAEPLKIPLKCTQSTAGGTLRQQQTAAIVPVAQDAVAVAYASDERLGGGKFDVFADALNQYGCADADPLLVNTTAGITAPDVAGGPTDAALVVWTQGTQITGRRIGVVRDATDHVSFQVQGDEIPIASNASAAKVAGFAQGWIVVYQGSGTGDGDGVFKRTVSTDGVVSADALVNLVTDGLQDQPDVAMQDDGRVVVVWRSARADGNTDVFAQRYDATGAPVSGDQDQPLDTLGTAQDATPVAAGKSGFFAVAWEHTTDAGSDIVARFLGASSGFGYNSVSGQNDAFPAGHPAIPFDPSTGTPAASARHAPAIAIGGRHDYVVIGWQDESPLHPGVYIRRFPAPEFE